MAYIVDGILRKTYVASIGGYKYHVASGRKAFESETDAQLYCSPLWHACSVTKLGSRQAGKDV